MILAIDPGSIESAYVLVNDNLKPIEFAKFNNQNVRQEIRRLLRQYYLPNKPINVAIEMVASYGMRVGQTVFDTCVWIGRFTEIVEHENINTHYIYRIDEKMNLCHSMKGVDDSAIRHALIDRFGVVGTKKNPGWFYEFKADVWQAYAVAVTYYDKYLAGGDDAAIPRPLNL